MTVTLEVREAVEGYLSSVEMFGSRLIDVCHLEMDGWSAEKSTDVIE